MDKKVEQHSVRVDLDRLREVALMRAQDVIDDLRESDWATHRWWVTLCFVEQLECILKVAGTGHLTDLEQAHLEDSIAAFEERMGQDNEAAA